MYKDSHVYINGELSNNKYLYRGLGEFDRFDSGLENEVQHFIRSRECDSKRGRMLREKYRHRVSFKPSGGG